MKNFERLAIEATIYDSGAPPENKNAMLCALRQEGSEFATAKVERAALLAVLKNFTANFETCAECNDDPKTFPHHACNKCGGTGIQVKSRGVLLSELYPAALAAIAEGKE